jgi:hypothetical protein
VKSLIRWFVSTFGGMIAGWFAAKGWFTVDEVLNVLNSPVLLGVASSIVVAVWGLFVHTQVNTVAAANALPAVAGVITAPTIEGKALADAVPADSVAVAGTSAAAIVAAK